MRGKIKLYNFSKAFMENLTILLVWCSCIYKQNIVSMILFIFLVLYSFYKNSTTLLLVRTAVSILMVLQYCADLIDFSSYNSPKRVPDYLKGEGQLIYPNEDSFFYGIPYIFSRNATQNETGHIIDATVNLNYTSYFMLDLEKRRMNGLWIDFIVTVLVAVYFNTCSFWILFRPVKIIMSKKTEKLLFEYDRLLNEGGNQKKRSANQILSDLKV